MNKCFKIIALTVLLFSVIAACRTPETEANPSDRDKPNMVLFIGDDHTYHDIGAYGNDEVNTPNIDRLADQGLVFEQAFTGASVCVPSRAQLYTGLTGQRSGNFPNHSVAYEETRSIVHHMRALGYRVAIAGKRHVGRYPNYPFVAVNGWKGVNIDAVRRYLTMDTEKPFLLVASSPQPHIPWDKGDPDQYDPENLTVPPYLIDTNDTRKDLQRYYAEITYQDRKVGQVMDLIDELNLQDETIFMYTSEQGSSLPRAKGSCYDAGQRTAFIVRWPGVTEPGTTTDAMIQYIDVTPTLVEAAGGKPDQVDTGRPMGPDGGRGFDGRSFVNVLKGTTDEHRRHVYLMHTSGRDATDETRFPIRAIRTDRFKYIRNLNPDGNPGQRIMHDSWKKKAKRDEQAQTLLNKYRTRPEEELYDLKEDPYELNNLADKQKYRDRIRKLRNKLNAWMDRTGDTGIELDRQVEDRQPHGGGGGVWKLGRPDNYPRITVDENN